MTNANTVPKNWFIAKIDFPTRLRILAGHRHRVLQVKEVFFALLHGNENSERLYNLNKNFDISGGTLECSQNSKLEYSLAEAHIDGLTITYAARCIGIRHYLNEYGQCCSRVAVTRFKS